MRIVLIADRPHGDRVERELRALGHEVAYVQDVHGHAYAAIHPGTDWVLVMNLHTDHERMQEKARTCGARWVWSQVGWSAAKLMLERNGFPFGGQLELGSPPCVMSSATAPLAVVPAQPPRAPFVFEGRPVRVQVDEGGEPWFCAADVCASLGIANGRDAVGRLDADEKTKKIQPSVLPTGVAPAPEVWFITEPGLYALVATSRKPEARRFDRWVRHEVLPAIRKAGAYVAPTAPAGALDLRNPAALQRLALELTSLVQEQGKALAAAQTQLAEAAPKLEAWQHLMDSTGLVPVTQAGKAFNIQPLKFFDWMLEQGHVYRQGRHLLARQDHIDSGRMRQSSTTLVVNKEQVLEFRAKLTGAGMAYFAERMEKFREACTAPPRRSRAKAAGGLLARAGVTPALPEVAR